jgi:hypothetical protein
LQPPMMLTIGAPCTCQSDIYAYGYNWYLNIIYSYIQHHPLRVVVCKFPVRPSTPAHDHLASWQRQARISRRVVLSYGTQVDGR